MKSRYKLTGFFVFLLITMASGLALAQNYAAIKTDASYYFYDSTSMDIFVERIDSVVLTGNETQYFGMREIRQTDQGCFTPDGASWIGDVVTMNTAGIFRFNVHPFSPADSSDIFTIHSDAMVGELWHFYNYHTINQYVEAKVTQIALANFLGISDSVKTITLQRKDISGENVNDPINGQNVLLSKNYGLIRLPKFDEFNSKLRFMDLCGKTNQITGRTNLTFKEIFDFQPGDEFHSQYLYTPYVYYYPTEEGSVVRTILEKIPVNSPDTVKYKVAQCKTNIHRSGINAPVYTHSFDTIIEQYTVSDFKQLMSEPGEPYILNDFMEYLSDNSMGMSANSFMNMSGIPWKLINSSGILWRYGSQDCWNYATYDDYTNESFYYKGLGGPYYSWMGFNITFNYNKLVYFKKGSETWGSPLSCDSLLQVGLPEPALNSPIRIYPNPTRGPLTIFSPVGIDFPLSLEIYDLSGRLSVSFTISQSAQSLDLTSLPAGTYMLKITSARGNVFRDKIIRQ